MLTPDKASHMPWLPTQTKQKTVIIIQRLRDIILSSIALEELFVFLTLERLICTISIRTMTSQETEEEVALHGQGDSTHAKTTTFTSSSSRLWKYLSLILLLLCLALLIALIVVATRGNDQRPVRTSDKVTPQCAEGMSRESTSSSERGLFEDLLEDEHKAVRDYMLGIEKLGLTPVHVAQFKAKVDSNFIAMIQFQPPSKAAALRYLDKNQAKPEREALVVIFKGAAKPPIVEEYIVGPVSKPTSHRLRVIPGRSYPIAFDSRPFLSVEIRALSHIWKNVSRKAYRLLTESFDGYSYHNCTDRCLTMQFSAPVGYTNKTRGAWYAFHRDHPPLFVYPLPFEIYIDHAGSDTSKWSVGKVYYNGQLFDSLDALLVAYDADTLNKTKIPDTDTLFSSYERRGRPQPSKPMRGPELYEPDGKRYEVRGRHVEYMNWAFDFRIDTLKGFQIYDIRFNGTRIIYELSLQEAIATYTGFSPVQGSNNFVDSNWFTGSNNHDLVPGVDCPGTATFFDVVHMADTSGPYTIKNAACLFELNSGIPLRRHYANDFSSAYRFYGGMTNQVLVLRTIATIGNYDYVHDAIFYQNGVIEVKMSASGFVSGSFYTPDVSPYGYPIHTNHLTSTTHDHLLHYKVDLDVEGTTNSYETIEIGIENTTNRFMPDYPPHLFRKVLKPSVKKTEQEALYKFNFDTPKYLNFFNEEKKNKMGVKKGYRIQHHGIMKQLYPEDFGMIPMISWSLYQLAVTRQKDSEPSSTSLYNQNAPSTPHIDFRDFVRDDEDIINQDLVAWVTTGLMHVPHSEDIPTTATPANAAGFFIRPFNYYDEDPSVGSSNAIVIKPANRDFTASTIHRFGTPTKPVCLPKGYNMTFDGRYGYLAMARGN
ncbi:amiloride-sensitive amine oxidase [copper-containing] [Nematostella vectensis]|nr:amiloride-sensitive amine oxidase [copper-containing] [Nematostella vectensis]